MTAVVPLMPTQPMLHPNLSKRNMSTAPRRSVPRAVVLVQQPTHPIFCHFEDRDVEQKFQTYFQREWQASIVGWMVIILLVCAAWCYLSSNAATLAITEAYTASIFADLSVAYSNKELISASSFSHVLWLDDEAFAGIAVMLYALAVGCIVHIWRRRGEYRFRNVQLDPVQLVLLLFYHCSAAPLFVVVLAGIEKQTRLSKQLSVVHLDNVRLTSVLVGEGFVDSLLFLELLGACVCTCLLRLQFSYCIVVVVELSIIAIVATGVHETISVVLNRRLSVLAAFLILLALLLRIVREQERSTRREFLTSFHLVTEARRLSSANLEIKEELSGKLNYQLHYEMGDILRILCQIKVKMGTTEKRDIDKIITALVRNHDLFEVTLSSTMPEYEEEVQGWLHMMDFKDHPSQSGDEYGSSAKPGSDGRRSRHYSLSNDILRVATSRRLSAKKVPYESFHFNNNDGLTRLLRTNSNVEEAFNTVIRPREDDLSSWLMNRLQNHFFVDMFYIQMHCAAPLQAVFLACVKLNGFIKRLELDEQKLLSFAAAVEERYHDRNPYHNHLHAAAVVADINFYLRRVHLNIDDSTLLVGLVAAAAHDISHPGVSNGFLIATKSNLAITYSDDSVLERMHIAELYRILSHDALDVFSHMAAPERAESRKIIIGMILATDLARHFQRISVLKTKKFAMSEEAQGLELSLLMETMLMLADLGHTAKPFAYHQMWAERISEEFFRQGETEEHNNLPISPLCDRKQANLPRSQVTFLTLVATPLFETAGQVFSIDEYDTVISELRNNIATWKERIENNDSAVLETVSADSHKKKTPQDSAG